MQYILWEGKFELNKNQPTSFKFTMMNAIIWMYGSMTGILFIYFIYKHIFNFACMEFKYIRCMIFDINHAGNQSNGYIWNKHIFT